MRLVTLCNLKGLNMANFDSTAVVNFMNLGGNLYAATAPCGGYEVVVVATVLQGERFKWAKWELATPEVGKAYKEWYAEWCAAIEAKMQLEEAAYPYEEEW
jgi:hypothetical protein